MDGEMNHESGSEENLKDLFERAKTIAVVGVKSTETEDAYRIPLYMQNAGYTIRPVNPKLDNVLDEPCVANVSDLETSANPAGSEKGARIDIINLFRASEHVPGHVDEILAMKTKPMAVWMQLGIHHGPSAQRLREAGIQVIQDRCIMVDHRRVTGAS